MQLDREDDVLTGSHAALRAVDPPPLSAPQAWFASPAPAVAVIVKKRRTLDIPGSGPADAAPSGGDAAADERRPRVFVLPKDGPAPEADQAAITAANTADAAAAAEAQPVRRRRRRLPEHRPSPVVHIVVPQPEAPPLAPTADGGDEAGHGFVLDLPSLQAWREVQSALASVRRLVQDAEHASRWGLAPAPRARRPRG